MLTISIQSGGRSRRMGQDKALMPFLGRPLICRMAERLAGPDDEVLVTASRPEAYAALGLRCIPDLLRGHGPLGGLYTALSAAARPLVAAVACDMPFASPRLLTYARDLLLSGSAAAVVPLGENGLEPLHAVYRRETCLPVVRAALAAGERRLVSWFDRLEVRILTLQETARLDPSGRAFWNLNTPEEFRQAEEIARQEKL